MQSIDYQSLVCLWVINNNSFLQQLQDELKSLKLDFLTTYTSISSSVADLDQKNAIYTDSKVSLFASWSYDKDLAVLSGQFNQLLLAQAQKISLFETTYVQKIAKFITEFSSYTKKNKDLLAQVGSKISLLQTLDSHFGVLTTSLDAYRSHISGSWSSFFSNAALLKNTSISGFDQSLQQIINTETKKNRILKNLSGVLLTQKGIVVTDFINQFDAHYNQFLSNFYDYAGYLALQTKIDAFHAKYLSANIYQCSKILTNTNFANEVSSMIKDIDQFSGTLSSGQIILWSWFQSKLTTWFSTLQSKQTSLLSGYVSFAQTTSQNMLAQYKHDNQTASPIVSDEPIYTDEPIVTDPIDPIITKPTTPVVSKPSTPVVSNSASGFVAPVGFSFTKTFKTNQKTSWVLVLQKLLKALNYYTGALNSTYTKATVSSVYHFQLDHGLLKWYEKKSQSRWRMGPATRKALNDLLH